MPALMVFAESTVTNGKALLDFKMGAFKDHKPMKIMGLQVPYNQFTCYDDFIEPVFA